MIIRNVFSEIEKYTEGTESIVLTGPRRVGKTTTLKYFYEKIASVNKIFLDIEDPLNRLIFDNVSYEDIKRELERLGLNFESKNYIFLDEIQFQKNLPSVIKYFHDHYQTKFFVSGSASFYLKNLFSESMAGRKFIFEMYPLSFDEFLSYKKPNYKAPVLGGKLTKATYEIFQPLYEEYILYGGFPQVILQETVEAKNKSLGEIFSAYFQKEIMQLSDFKNNATVRDFILLLTERVGQKLDIQKISSELGVSRPTIYNFLEFLKGTYLIDLVPPYGKIDSSIRKQDKIYFLDSGLLNHLGKKEMGNVFENSIFTNLKSKYKERIYYYQKENKEVDFIAENSAFEIKLFSTPQDFRKLKRLSDKLKISGQYVFSYRYSEAPNTIYGFQGFE